MGRLRLPAIGGVVKRTQIQRKTPLRAARPRRWLCESCGAEREGSTCDRCGSSGLPPILTARPVAKPKRPKDVIPAHTRAALEERSGGVCERCQQARATDAHHIVLRSRGGDHSLDNLGHLCHACHMLLHANPELAEAEGLMKRRAS